VGAAPADGRSTDGGNEAMSDIISEAMQPGGDAVLDALGQKGQSVLSVTTETMTAWTYKATEAARERQALAEAQTREHNERLRAQHKAAMPLMQRVWNERWWARPPTPEQIGQTFEIVGGWAATGDDYAKHTLLELVSEVRSRYTLTPEQLSTLESGAEALINQTGPGPSRDDVARILAADPAAEHAGDGQRADLSDGPERAFSYVIRDARDGRVLRHATEPWLVDDGRPLELIAAELLSDFTAEHPTDPVTDATAEHDTAPALPDAEESAPDRFQITIAEGTVTAQELAAGEHFSLTEQQADPVRQDYDEWSRDARAGLIEATPQQLHDAHRVVLTRLRDELEALTPDSRLQAAREYLIEEVAGRGRADERVPSRRSRPDPAAGLSPEQVVERVADLRESIAAAQRDVEVAEARVRGEDPGAVLAARQLRSHLDAEWWQAASPREIGHLYEHVSGWSEGHAKDAMLRDLRAGMHRVHGVAIAPDATADRIAEAVKAAQADQAGMRYLTYEISGPDAETPRGTGTVTVAKGTPLDHVAVERLTDFAGDSQTAMAQHLTIRFSAPEGRIGAYDARGRHMDATRREAEARLRARSGSAAAEATRLDEGATALRNDHDPHSDDRADLWRVDAADERAGAAADAADADSLDRLSHLDPEAGRALRNAAPGAPGTVKARLNAYRGRRRPQLGRTSGPRSNRTLGQHRGRPPER
jgi:hypothetical protein